MSSSCPKCPGYAWTISKGHVLSDVVDVCKAQFSSFSSMRTQVLGACSFQGLPPSLP